MDYTVVIGDLRFAAAQAHSARTQAAGLAPGDQLAEGGAGMPGADAVTLIAQVQQVWGSELAAWTDRAGSYGDHLETAANTYQRGDDASGQSFDYLNSGM